MPAIEQATMDAVLQPIRFRILATLMDFDKPLYIDQIAKLLGEGPRLVAHHLEILEDSGLVMSEFKIIESKSARATAGRFFTPTERARATLEEIGRTGTHRKR